MRKRRGDLFIFSSIALEIGLLILMSFAIAFIWSESVGVVSAQFEELTDPMLKESLKPHAVTPSKAAGGAVKDIPKKTPTPTPKPDPTGGQIITGHLVDGVIQAVVVAGAVKLIGDLLGMESEETNAAALAIGAGIISAQVAYGIFKANAIPDSWFYKPETTFGLTGTRGEFWSGVIGIGVGLLVLVQTYKKQKEDIATFKCYVWEPLVGGDDCEKCNNDPLRPCTEYRCRSLGQACEIVNPGTEKEKCVWVNPHDVNSPTITPWEEALKPIELSYSNVNIRPPRLGMKIVKGADGCLVAFTPLEFGLLTNEPAQCKVDYNHTDKFEDMRYYFGGENYYLYNHTNKMTLSGIADENYDLTPVLQNDGAFTLFVRCRDKNGNENVDEFAINFCIDPSPDTTPPVIEASSIISGNPVQFGVEEVEIGMFVNEPADCRWSRDSKAYEEMENAMDCSANPMQMNADLQYTCIGNLTGIKDREENKFYFRCKDQPGKPETERNVMVQSYELILRGSQPLNIISVGPNETISGNTDTIVVELSVRTDDGADEGNAICLFSETGEEGTYLQMFDTGGFEHKQSLDLASGRYTYHVRCVDAGGNSAERSVGFRVIIDRAPPAITRIYKEDGLKIVTNEDAECVYSLADCNYNFEEGLAMIYSNPSIRTSHFAEWRPGVVYYIKCKDEFDNMPAPNSCSISVSAIELE